jgi:hypothetical protein
MRAYRVVLSLLVLCLASCGPILGQAMRATEGIRSFEVTEGHLGDLPTGGQLLVFGPFAKTDAAFYICRGEDAADFALALRDADLFRTELYLERDYDRLEATVRGLREKTPPQLQAALGLTAPPDLLLFGTLLHRSMIVAPTRGVITDVGYRLEFFDPGTRRSVTVEIAAKEPFERAVTEITRELAERRARAP